MLNELLKGYKEKGSSRANKEAEINVMKELLNDKSFKVGIYKEGEGKVGEYSPYEDRQQIVTEIIEHANISKAEAAELASLYEFSKKSASAMVNLSKEFVNTYIGSGIPMNFGGRENINLKLKSKEVPEKEITIKPGTIGNKTDKPITKKCESFTTVKNTGKNIYV